MRYALWFSPTELAQQIATLLIMFCGFALMLRQKRIAMSLFLVAMALLAAPLLEPMADEAVAATAETGHGLLNQLPWWVIVIASAMVLLFLLRMVLTLLFGARVAGTAVGTLVADGIRLVLRVLILGPFRLFFEIVRTLIR